MSGRGGPGLTRYRRGGEPLSEGVASKLPGSLRDVMADWQDRLGETEAAFIREAIGERCARLEAGLVPAGVMENWRSMIEAGRDRAAALHQTMEALLFAASNERDEALGG